MAEPAAIGTMRKISIDQTNKLYSKITNGSRQNIDSWAIRIAAVTILYRWYTLWCTFAPNYRMCKTRWTSETLESTRLGHRSENFAMARKVHKLSLLSWKRPTRLHTTRSLTTINLNSWCNNIFCKRVLNHSEISSSKSSTIIRNKKSRKKKR
jgi:hypothetical protein